jgi:hypothetical protein
MTTYSTILDRSRITCPDDTLADIDVPVLTGPQRQGDVGIWPTAAPGAAQLARTTPNSTR